MKTKFDNWIKETKKKITRSDKYSRAITTISNDFTSLKKNIDLYKITDPDELSKLKEEYLSIDQMKEKNKRGHNMYSRAFDLYIEFHTCSK